MNENLRRAMVNADVGEVDVAASLRVDPKTVRRWIEGRLPRPRNRQAIAALTGVDEYDLWPELRADRVVPLDVTTFYPHRWAAPESVWTDTLGTALWELDILDLPEPVVLEAGPTRDELLACASRGVFVRLLICGEREPEQSKGTPLESLPSEVEVRTHRSRSYHAMLRADDQILAHHFAEGIPREQTPVVHLTKVGDARMYASYVEGFERIWRSAVPAVSGDGGEA